MRQCLSYRGISIPSHKVEAKLSPVFWCAFALRRDPAKLGGALRATKSPEEGPGGAGRSPEDELSVLRRAHSMEEIMERVEFIDPDTGQCTEFYVLEQTTIGGSNYLMVTLDEDGDSDAFILKELAGDDSQTTYEMVDEDKELEAIAKVFAELMEDVDIEF